MVERASGYYRYPFQGSWGVTQGGPMYPCIFNVMVYVIIYHWVGMVAENEAIPDVFRYMMEYNAAFLYYYDCLIESSNLVWLQWGFNVLISVYDMVGIRTNLAKKVAMLCQPGPISWRHSDEAYNFWTTVKGYPHCVT